MIPGTLHQVLIEADWDRLHRAESDVLASLLSASEQAAVNRRLGLTAVPPAWVPASAGDLGGRFSEPTGPGALYLGNDLLTCEKEIEYHHSRSCAASVGTPPGTRAVFQHLVFHVSGAMADASKARMRGLHHPTDYTPSWSYARLVRGTGLEGVHCRSVRCRGGSCLAVFSNQAATFLRVVFGAVVLEWDGAVSRRIA